MSQRTEKIQKLAKQVLGEAIHDLKDPRVGFVTVTDVRTSPDLRQARVYVSVLGDDAARSATLEGLASAHGVLQGRIGRELRMKRTPTLEFSYDDTAERADRLGRLMDDLETPR